MKLARSFFCTLVLLGGTLFVIDWFCDEIDKALNIPVSILGLVLVSAGISAPYAVYNLKSCKKETDNVEFF